ncbi:MAG: (2Fe-2S)-binding protein [Deltaproteobacteria bacterium]|nr:MAG: (2Fe-2S)-binding protein [Deltaproteobacteria bacterium]
MEKLIKMTVNGKKYEIAVEPNQTLVEVLREALGLTGTKVGCEMGDCGTCTVIMDGKAVNACLVLAAQADGREILTIEGLAEDERLHPLQEAFVMKGAIQCGFCTPGMIMNGKALLDKRPDPDEAAIREAISGVLCRCTGYRKIVQAIKSASGSARSL